MKKKKSVEQLITYDNLREGDLILELPNSNAHGHANLILEINSQKVKIVDMPGTQTGIREVEQQGGFKITAEKNVVFRIKDFAIKQVFLQIVGKFKAQTTLIYSKTVVTTIKGITNENLATVGRFYFLDHIETGASTMTESTLVRILKFSHKYLDTGITDLISAKRGVTCLHWLLISMQSAFIIKRMRVEIGDTSTKIVIDKMHTILSQNVTKKRISVNKKLLKNKSKWIIGKHDFSNYNITSQSLTGSSYKQVWNNLLTEALSDLEYWQMMKKMNELTIDKLLPSVLHVDAKYSSPKKFIHSKVTDKDFEIITHLKN